MANENEDHGELAIFGPLSEHGRNITELQAQVASLTAALTNVSAEVTSALAAYKEDFTANVMAALRDAKRRGLS